MPNRILHERICTSETMAMLSPGAEVFFYRLMVQCDDFGRFDGRPAVIRARCYPLQLDRVTDADVERWLAEIYAAQLINLYIVDGRSYLHVVTWDRYQQTRAKTSKYPDPPTSDSQPSSNESNGNQLIADASTRKHMSPYPEAISGSDTREAISGSDAREIAVAATAEPPPKQAKVMPVNPERAVPKPNKYAETLDAIRELEPEHQVGGDSRLDAAAIKASAAPPGKIAAAYVAVLRGQWGDDWMRDNLSLQFVVKRLDGYEAHLRAPPKSKNGQTAVGSNDLNAQRQRYATSLKGGPT